ncbi:hypothetical protein A3A79_04140 [Candidatus Gottesmanbacteria bacterium RIFCSPLOWO2_01_FULL_43_11b]|uniref:N-acetyltransferase domain-containing protein n=1 Tax=Candidatus Gottesmanbacteria bacterium RIFCSPLOWO2_01_FULL_43_11b TaxID=1798392 RepID=A0A1F6AIA3_9BACT|nr:MAG: hypothetical protein A3A79_04140 [Candidatus Gottesmanbacteria bacterium RIFCSPLOWO2_01_FULL_43_11b]
MTDSKSVKVMQNIDQAIEVMRDAGKWLAESGKNPSEWWKLENLNSEFLLQYAKPEEFYVATVDDKPAAAAILQFTQTGQDWQNVDKDFLQPALYIHWLCVHRDFAGKNLPKIMIEFAEKLAQKNDVKLLRVDTNAEEMKLRNMYEKLGFELIIIMKEDYRKTALYQKRVKWGV